MNRIWNFNAGPAVLPEAVLRQAANDMLDWRGCGMSVMEMSHRGKEFIAIRDEAEELLRSLLNVPAHYEVLFLQGGGSGANAFVPMNLIGRAGRADYVVSGQWSLRSAQEAAKYGQVNIAASSEPDGFASVPPRSEWKLDESAAYVHLCSNETIGGVQVRTAPGTGSVPLVADMSSDFLSRRVDVSSYGLIYAGAQKNVGPAGLTIVLVRRDLLGHALPITPTAFNYAVQAKAGSMYNTPPTYGIYIAGLVFRHLRDRGGLEAMEALNTAKSTLLYDFIDASRLYENWVAREDRSTMNVPFRLVDRTLDEAFLAGAQKQGIVGLKGHRSVGGMRASLYNAMSIEGVRALVAYMNDFEAEHAARLEDRQATSR